MIESNPPSNIQSFFVGRDTIFARVQQQILDPPHRHAIVFTGHDGMGKTALLKQLTVIFDESILPIYVPLANDNTIRPSGMLRSLHDGINYLLNEYNYSLSRVPELDTDDETPFDEWFHEVYLPVVLSIIRTHRRIIWLIDDAHHLANVSSDFLGYLHQLLIDFPQFSIILTINTDHEATLAELHPLVNPTLAERIHRLSAEDSKSLIRHYAPGANGKIVDEIFSATGGHPSFLTRYGKTLQDHWADYGDQEAFKLAKSDVYVASQDDFAMMWRKLSRDERLVLTAIASVIYDDPLQPVTPARIETWLVETDYLLDLVAIHSALRGLDYQDIVSQRKEDNIKLTMDLLQQWLLEKARLDDDVSVQRGQLPIRLIIGAIVIIVILVLIVLQIPLPYLESNSAIPTATLTG